MKRPRIMLSAQHLEAGITGIARVARLTMGALAERYDVQALAVNDYTDNSIKGAPIRAFNGNRLKFLVANNLTLQYSDAAIYDFAGTARAHLFSKTPYALWVHGNEIWEQSALRSDYRRVIVGASLVIVNSALTMRALNDEISDLPPTEICWLATERSDPIPDRTRDSRTLLFVGHSYANMSKGQDILIQAWPQVLQRMPDARLVFAGGGVNEAALKRMAESSPAGASIDVLGLVTEEELERLWQQAAALALLGRSEGFGLVIVEAMRQGLPVLTSNQDAGCEINVDGITGFNVDRLDRESIVERIFTLLSDKDMSRAMGVHGRNRWDGNFTSKRFESRFLDIFERHMVLA